MCWFDAPLALPGGIAGDLQTQEGEGTVQGWGEGVRLEGGRPCSVLAEGLSGLRSWQSRDSNGKDGAVMGPSSCREGRQSTGCQFIM